LKKILSSKHIYEFDLKGFFNNINTNSVTKELLSMEVPKKIVYMIENINQSQVKLTEEDKVDESIIRTKQALQNYLMGKGPEPEYPDSFKDLLKNAGWPLIIQMMKEDECESV